MAASSAPPLPAPRPDRAVRRRGGRPTRRAELPAPRRRPHDLEAVASRWQQALDAASRALAAAKGSLPAAEVAGRMAALARERQETAEALARSARAGGVTVPWLSAVPVTRAMLRLPAGTRACLFDLDGVLTDSGVLHARAWGVVFDDFLLRLSEKTGWQFVPFDRVSDYRTYVEGRPRLDAVHAFLDSRGIRLPEGPSADAHADTARGLAECKGEVVARAVETRGVSAVRGARRYLEAAGRAGIARGVVSASANTLRMLEQARLDVVVDDWIDVDVLREEALRPPPATDVPLAACRRLGARPEETVWFTHSASGLAAAQAAALLAIAVGRGIDDRLDHLRAADGFVPGLGSLLDSRIARLD